MLIDSHAHLDMEDFENDRAEVLDRAGEGGITHIITVGTDLQSSLRAVELANAYDFIFSSIGYHPHNAKAAAWQTLQALSRLVSEPKVVGWGEIGLDFYRRYSPPQAQRAVFKKQLEMAIDVDLPVIIHDRESGNEVLDTLKEVGGAKWKGVIHCFSGDFDLAMAFIDMGFYISIPGTVTYKNALQVQDVASRIPLECMLLETDAPFLAPNPKRGKRNEPLYVTYTAQKIGQLRNLDFHEIARQTSENASRLFDLPSPERPPSRHAEDVA